MITEVRIDVFYEGLERVQETEGKIKRVGITDVGVIEICEEALMILLRVRLTPFVREFYEQAVVGIDNHPDYKYPDITLSKAQDLLFMKREKLLVVTQFDTGIATLRPGVDITKEDYRFVKEFVGK